MILILYIDIIYACGSHPPATNIVKWISGYDINSISIQIKNYKKAAHKNLFGIDWNPIVE